jgi:4-amino-4-deoxy-L-arabinose transferase-like glycosyltransferase
MSLGDLLDTLRTSDVHPPLHHLVLWVTIRIAGSGELAVRLPSLIAAVALIPLLYAAGRALYDRRAGLAAAALATVAPFTVWYAQEARMYSLFMLFALLSVWFQARALRDGRRRDWAGFTVAAAALVATQYFGLLLVGVQQVVFLAALCARRADRERLRALAIPWLVSGAALTLLLAPVIAFGQDQFAANEAAGKGFQKVPSQTGGALDDSEAAPGPYAAITNVVWALLGYHSDATMTRLAALWPLLMLLVLALLGRGRSWRTGLIVAAAGLPALALFGLGQLKPFVFEVRYFIGLVPLALLLAGRAATSWSPRPATQIAVTAAAAMLLAGGLADQQLNGDNPRVYDFRGALEDVAERARPGDVLVYSPQYLGPVVEYYAGEVDARPLDDGLPEPRRGRRVILLGSFFDKPHYREVAAEAVRDLKRGHELDAARRYPQIRVWEFTR